MDKAQYQLRVDSAIERPLSASSVYGRSWAKSEFRSFPLYALLPSLNLLWSSPPHQLLGSVLEPCALDPLYQGRTTSPLYAEFKH
jgi:hypothetical protein